MQAQLNTLESVVSILDDAIEIPIIKKRIGLDPIIGLIPWLGDVLGLSLSIIPILYAIKFDVPLRIILRMIINSLFDTTLGSIPVLGDIFDFFYKSNRKNFYLLKSYLENPEKTKRRTTVQFIFILLLIALLFTLISITIWLLLSSLFFPREMDY